MKTAILFLIFIDVTLSKRVLLLPYNSRLCANESRYQLNRLTEFTISNQINIETTDNVEWAEELLQNRSRQTVALHNHYSSSLDVGESIYLTCRLLLRPMGRSIEEHLALGAYYFWNLRTQSYRFGDNCHTQDGGRLLMQFRHSDNDVTEVDGYAPKSFNVSCHNAISSPVFINSTLRKLYMTYFSPTTVTTRLGSAGYAVNVTSFINFVGKLSLKYQLSRCQMHEGFWCPVKPGGSSSSTSGVCIFRDLRCDGQDSCHDGGSDEKHCNMPVIDQGLTVNDSNLVDGNNGSGPWLPRRGGSGSNSAIVDYLPWLALGLLPLVLLLALVCICNQQRSDVYFDDDEVDVEGRRLGGGMACGSHGVDDCLGASEDELDDLDLCDVEIRGGSDGDCVAEKTANAEEWGSVHEDGPDEERKLEAVQNQDGSIGMLKLNSPQKNGGLMSHSASENNYEDVDQTTALISNNSNKKSVLSSAMATGPSASMTMSQMTEDDYDDHLEDVGSLLRKVDRSKIPEEVRQSINPKPSAKDVLTAAAASSSEAAGEAEYRADYILV